MRISIGHWRERKTYRMINVCGGEADFMMRCLIIFFLFFFCCSGVVPALAGITPLGKRIMNDVCQGDPECEKTMLKNMKERCANARKEVAKDPKTMLYYKPILMLCDECSWPEEEGYQEENMGEYEEYKDAYKSDDVSEYELRRLQEETVRSAYESIKKKVSVASSEQQEGNFYSWSEVQDEDPYYQIDHSDAGLGREKIADVEEDKKVPIDDNGLKSSRFTDEVNKHLGELEKGRTLTPMQKFLLSNEKNAERLAFVLRWGPALGGLGVGAASYCGAIGTSAAAAIGGALALGESVGSIVYNSYDAYHKNELDLKKFNQILKDERDRIVRGELYSFVPIKEGKKLFMSAFDFVMGFIK